MRTSSSRPCVPRPRPSPTTCAGTCWWTVSSPATRSSTPRTGTTRSGCAACWSTRGTSETGLRHGSLQMIHALGDDLFDPEEAAHHVALVREHLMGVDGVRLFDRPPPYSGGLMRHFQRAETATFVGREIGLMYVHAHLRWCEAMARWGDAEALWLGLQQVLPPATVAVVPGARRRQANAYPSSSDAACLDREDFAARYAEVLTGATGLEGGWRIYSSGPGVLLRIVVQSVLGVRRRAGTVEIDPVLPSRLDGLTADVPLAGGLLRVRYRVGDRGHGPSGVRLGGRDLAAVAGREPLPPRRSRPRPRPPRPGPSTRRRRARDPPAVDDPTGPMARPRRPTTDDVEEGSPAMTDVVTARASPLTAGRPGGRGVPRPQRQRPHGPLRGPTTRPAVTGRGPPRTAVARGEGRPDVPDGHRGRRGRLGARARRGGSASPRRASWSSTSTCRTSTSTRSRTPGRPPGGTTRSRRWPSARRTASPSPSRPTRGTRSSRTPGSPSPPRRSPSGPSRSASPRCATSMPCASSRTSPGRSTSPSASGRPCTRRSTSRPSPGGDGRPAPSARTLTSSPSSASPTFRGSSRRPSGRAAWRAPPKHFPGGGPQKDGEDPHFPYGREQVYPGGRFADHLKPFPPAIRGRRGRDHAVLRDARRPRGRRREDRGGRLRLQQAGRHRPAAREAGLRRRRRHRLGARSTTTASATRCSPPAPGGSSTSTRPAAWSGSSTPAPTSSAVRSASTSSSTSWRRAG